MLFEDDQYDDEWQDEELDLIQERKIIKELSEDEIDDDMLYDYDLELI